MRWHASGMIVALLVGLAQPVWAAPGLPMVQGIRVDPITQQLVVTTTGDIVPQITQLSNPPRLVVDFAGQLGDIPRQLAGWLPSLKGVRLSQYLPESGRIVFDLDQPMNVEIAQEKGADGLMRSLFRLVDVVQAENNTLQAIDVSDQSLMIMTSGPTQPLITQVGNRVTIQIPRVSVPTVPTMPLASSLFEHLSASVVGDTLVLTATLTRTEPLGFALSDNGRMVTVEARSPWAKLQVQSRNGPSEASLIIRGDRRFTYQVERVDNHIVVTTNGTYAEDARQAFADGTLKGLRVGKGESGGTTVFALETPKPTAYAIGLSEDGRTLAVTLKREAVKVTVPPAHRDTPLIVLDPGHGGHDPGAIGPGGTQEKAVTLSVIRMLEEELHRMGWRTSLARHDDSEIDLAPRVAVANTTKADLFVSVHCNSLDRNWIQGIETYYRNPFSIPLAKKLHASLVGNLGSPDRGIRYANFYVIHHTTMPAVLCEIGYISHAEEEQKLSDPAYQRKVAKSLAEGLKAYWTESRKGS
ncbi:MAG: N-acetylmuramoyl-L-alanine amidase [Candidatus Sericytochromatia bacterium]|nr:N-acetylmuramoyl-L-alanine amidase [Candidatus Sericytochromatia bacterium]